MFQRWRFRRRFTESISVMLADPSANDDGDRFAKLVGDRMHLRHLDRSEANDKTECFLFAHAQRLIADVHRATTQPREFINARR